MARKFTAELLRKKNNGKTIVCSLPPHQNQPVTYQPRHRNDAQPWYLEGAAYRFSGNECHAIDASKTDQPCTSQNDGFTCKRLDGHTGWHLGRTDTGILHWNDSGQIYRSNCL